jgi:death-on-curing protein
LIAEAVLEIPAERLIEFDRVVPLAESALHAPRASFLGTEAYPEFEVKAAVLCSRLIRNHPLPDGNKRTAYLCLTEFVERNGHVWVSADPDETVEVMAGVAAREIGEDELTHWVRARLQ